MEETPQRERKTWNHDKKERTKTDCEHIHLHAHTHFLSSAHAEDKDDCNRKSCGVPVAVDNADHTPVNPAMSEENVTYEYHAVYSVGGTPDGHKSFTTTCGVAASGSMAVFPTQKQSVPGRGEVFA